MRRFNQLAPLLLPLLLAVAAPRAYASPPPSGGIEHVPAAWSNYAATVSHQLQAGLGNAHDPAAIRFHRFLDDRANANPDSTPLTLILRLWIAANGTIRQLEFNSTGDMQANADLYRIIMATTGLKPPPPAMRHPLVLQLQLTYSM